MIPPEIELRTIPLHVLAADEVEDTDNSPLEQAEIALTLPPKTGHTDLKGSSCRGGRRNEQEAVQRGADNVRIETGRRRTPGTRGVPGAGSERAVVLCLAEEVWRDGRQRVA